MTIFWEIFPTGANMNNFGKTVAAVSTPKGKGGVAMVRISGNDAVAVASKVFFSKSGKNLSEYAANTAVYGEFVQDGQVFDNGMALCFYAPKSFTGENTVELYCHGGLLVTKKLLEAVIEAGAAYAGPGEFTRRAFVNGKLTLTEAEAVGDMIDAKSEAHLGAGIKGLKGVLSKNAEWCYQKLKTLAASAYAFIDYPDEDLTDVSVEEMKEVLGEVYDRLYSLYKTSKYGKAISEGVPAAIVGRPNTGKSSLLNLLCGSERAIVTDIEGTTRDVVTEQVNVGDVILNLSDTAGIRETSDVVESIGVKRSFGEIDRASLVILVLDGEITSDDQKIIDYILAVGKSENTIALQNKCDRKTVALPGIFKNEIAFSALNGAGLDALTKAVSEMCGYADCEGAETVITSARQAAMLKSAAETVRLASESLEGFTQEIAGMQIEEAIGILAELDGRQASGEIVDEIFSKFCVGK